MNPASRPEGITSAGIDQDNLSFSFEQEPSMDADNKNKKVEEELAFIGTIIFSKDQGDTDIVVPLTDRVLKERIDFETRFTQLCGKTTAGQDVLQKLQNGIKEGEDPWKLAEQALSILYQGQESNVPHITPYFYDAEVIERLFYGDKGLFLRFLGKGGFGKAILVRNADEEGRTRNEVWKIANSEARWHEREGGWGPNRTLFTPNQWLEKLKVSSPRKPQEDEAEWLANLEAEADRLGTRDAKDAALLERLIRETKANAELGTIGVSPKLLHQGSISSEDGIEHPYFATDYNPGVTLDKLMSANKGKTSPALTADIGVLYSVLLSRAHHRNYVHRDIKPENLYMGDDGKPKILDWGLSSHGRSRVMTYEGTVMGTPSYLSPEQAQGASIEATEKSDTYSLALTLYEMQTGTKLFDDENTFVLLQKHISAERDLSSLAECGVPPVMVQALAKALHVKSTERLDAEKLARQLWPHSSLYLQNGKIPFDEFLEQFETLGRLNVPRQEGHDGTVSEQGDVSSIPSRFATLDMKSVKGIEDLKAESESAGLAMNTALLQRTSSLIEEERGRIEALLRTKEAASRRKRNRKIFTGAGAVAAAALLAVVSASLIPTKPEKHSSLPGKVEPDSNALVNVPACLDFEKLADGTTKTLHLFPGTKAAIKLDGDQFLELRDEKGLHAFVFSIGSDDARKLLDYPEDWEGFPADDELPNIPTKGLESPCFTFLDPNTGATATSYYDLKSWVVTLADGTMRVYTHRVDLRLSQAKIFEESAQKKPGASFSFHGSTDVLKDPVFEEIMRAFPLDLQSCNNPTQKSPAAAYDRPTLAKLPKLIVEQHLPQFPEKIATENPTVKNTALSKQ